MTPEHLPPFNLFDSHAIISHRLDRIEESQALLNAAVADVARAVAKFAEALGHIESLKRDEARHNDAIIRIHARIDALEQDSARHSVYISLASGVIGAALTGAVGMLFL